MRRSTLTLALTVAGLTLGVAIAPAAAGVSRAEQEEALEQRRQEAQRQQQRAASNRMAQVLIQEELARRQRQEQAAGKAGRQTASVDTDSAMGSRQVRDAGPAGASMAADGGLDAVFGSDENLSLAADHAVTDYPSVVVPATPRVASRSGSTGSAAADPSGSGYAPSVTPGLPAVDAGPTPESHPVPEPRLELFHTGYSHYSQGDFEAARRAFATFLVENPGHELADSAQYWLGQCAVAQGDYSTALLEYRRVVDSFPFGDKVADALLKVGDVLQELGRGAEARDTWQRLIAEFPASGAARRARERLGDGTPDAAAQAAAASGA